MKGSEPSISDWKALYEAAIEFKSIGCWSWMLDSDVFGVQNPMNNEVGYCCVMGHLGEHFALAVYLGTEGLEVYLKMQSGAITEGNFEAFMIQKCLTASFEDRDLLSKEDLEVIRKLRLKFRGRHQWPFFRNYQPGYHPWYLSKDEAKFLTLALQQAIDVSLRFKEKSDMLIPHKKGHYLVRVPKKKGSEWQWEDKWLKPEPKKESSIAVLPVNEVRLQRIKKTIKRMGGIWEADFFFSPVPVREEKEKPYYPYTILYVSSQSGLILSADIVKSSDIATEFPNSFMELMEKAGVKPTEILVRREEAYELLKLVASRLDIKLRLVKRLEQLEYAQASMFQFLR